MYGQTERYPMNDKELRLALKSDFRKLYGPRFTTDYEAQRLVRDTEIEIMALDSLESLIQEAVDKEVVMSDKEKIAEWLETLHCDNWRTIGCTKSNCQLFRSLAKSIREEDWS
jgi:hypothetical protein